MTNSALKDQYARATRMIGFALTLSNDPEVWDGLSLVLSARLTPEERSCLLEAAARSMHPDDVLFTLNNALVEFTAGPPLPVLDVIDDDARWWADLATLPEHKAYLAACFVRLPVREQQQFLASAMRRVA